MRFSPRWPRKLIPRSARRDGFQRRGGCRMRVPPCRMHFRFSCTFCGFSGKARTVRSVQTRPFPAFHGDPDAASRSGRRPGSGGIRNHSQLRDAAFQVRPDAEAAPISLPFFKWNHQRRDCSIGMCSAWTTLVSTVSQRCVFGSFPEASAIRCRAASSP